MPHYDCWIDDDFEFLQSLSSNSLSFSIGHTLILQKKSVLALVNSLFGLELEEYQRFVYHPVSLMDSSRDPETTIYRAKLKCLTIFNTVLISRDRENRRGDPPSVGLKYLGVSTSLYCVLCMLAGYGMLIHDD